MSGDSLTAQVDSALAHSYDSLKLAGDIRASLGRFAADLELLWRGCSKGNKCVA